MISYRTVAAILLISPAPTWWPIAGKWIDPTCCFRRVAIKHSTTGFWNTCTSSAWWAFYWHSCNCSVWCHPCYFIAVYGNESRRIERAEWLRSWGIDIVNVDIKTMSTREAMIRWGGDYVSVEDDTRLMWVFYLTRVSYLLQGVHGLSRCDFFIAQGSLICL